MKNSKIVKSLFILTLFLSVLCVITSCTKKFKVTFEVEGSIVKEVEVKKGKTVAAADVPTDPEKDGFEFVGWFNGSEEFSTSKEINSDVKYAAKFNQIKYTVSFEVDGSVVKSVEVNAGGKVAASDVPVDPVKDGFEFNGWYSGNTKFDANAVVNASVKYTAKFTEVKKEVYTVTFEIDGEVAKEVEVEEGKTINPADIPTDPTKKAFEFVGWFNGEDEFDEEAPVSASVTYAAKFERTHYIVTFDDEEVLVAVGETLSLADIENPQQADAFFAGWVCDGVVATEGMEVTSDMAFVAKFVTEASFNGFWATTEGEWIEINDGTVVSGEFGVNGVDFTFDVATGKLSYSDTSTLYYDRTNFSFNGDDLVCVHEYWDTSYEEDAVDTITYKAQEPTGYEGIYVFDHSHLIEIVDGGIVKRFGSDTGITVIGIVKVDGDTIQIVYRMPISSSNTTITVTFDANGNLVVENKIYVKNVTEGSYRHLYNSGNPSVEMYEVDGEKVVIIYEDGVPYMATYEGEIAEGEIVVFSYNDKTMTVKVGALSTNGREYPYSFASDEKGTYTNGDHTIVLDGFGNATVDGEEAEYVLNAVGVAIIDGKGYKINTEDQTYTEVTKDNVNTGKYVLNTDSKYVLTFDGFGGATLDYNSSYTVYYGKYVLSDNQIVVSGCQYYANGTWSIEEDGNFLYNGERVYILEGAQLVDHREELKGTYGDNGEIVVLDGKIRVNGEEYNLTYNFNGTKASYKVKHSDKNPEYGNTVEFEDTITISKKGDNLLVETEHVTWDEDGVEPESTVTSAEYVPHAPVLDGYQGTWKGQTQDGNNMEFTFDGIGKVTFNGQESTYSVKNGVINLSFDLYEFTVTGDPSTGELKVSGEYDYMTEIPEFTITREGGGSSVDAFKGTWKGESFSSTNTFVINGDGTGTYNSNEITYTITDSGDLEFELGGETYTLKGDPTTGKLTAEFTFEGEPYGSYQVTKEAEPQDDEEDAFKGTWTGKAINSVTYVINGDGTGTFNGNEITYIIDDNGDLVIEYGGETYTLKGDPTTGKLTVEYTYDGFYAGSYEVTK